MERSSLLPLLMMITNSFVLVCYLIKSDIVRREVAY